MHESGAAVAATVAADITEATAAAALEAHLRMPSTTAAMPSFEQLCRFDNGGSGVANSSPKKKFLAARGF